MTRCDPRVFGAIIDFVPGIGMMRVARRDQRVFGAIIDCYTQHRHGMMRVGRAL